MNTLIAKIEKARIAGQILDSYSNLEPSAKLISLEDFEKEVKEGDSMYAESIVKSWQEANEELIKKNPEKKEEILAKSNKEIASLKKFLVIGPDDSQYYLYLKKKEETEVK